jgi:hypothetical protein
MLASIPSEVFLEEIILNLDIPSFVKLSTSSKYFRELLDLPDQWWRHLVIKTYHGIDLLTKRDGVLYKTIFQRFWNHLHIDWRQVIGDPHFIRSLSFLHIADYCTEVFSNPPPSKSTRLIFDEESPLNLLESDEFPELYVDLFLETADFEIFARECSTLNIPLPNENTLNIIFGCQGLYFFFNKTIDIGRLDGHQSMPALRWEECVEIASYVTAQHTNFILSESYVISILSLLTFPTLDTMDDYCTKVSDAFMAIGIWPDTEDGHQMRQLWCSAFRDDDNECPRWELDGGVWVHPWSARNNRTPTAQLVHAILHPPTDAATG